MLPDKCSRTECDFPLGDAYYEIYNQPSTGTPQKYCVICGRDITIFNPELDYDIVRIERIKVKGKRDGRTKYEIERAK